MVYAEFQIRTQTHAVYHMLSYICVGLSCVYLYMSVDNVKHIYMQLHVLMHDFVANLEIKVHRQACGTHGCRYLWHE